MALVVPKSLSDRTFVLLSSRGGLNFFQGGIPDLGGISAPRFGFGIVGSLLTTNTLGNSLKAYADSRPEVFGDKSGPVVDATRKPVPCNIVACVGFWLFDRLGLRFAREDLLSRNIPEIEGRRVVELPGRLSRSLSATGVVGPRLGIDGFVQLRL